MDPELAGLATVAAKKIMEALTTTAWEQARKAIGSLWRRAHPDRADTVEAEIAETREELMAARQARDEQSEQDLVAAWRSRLRGLLAADASLADDVRNLIKQLQPTPAENRSLTVGRADMHAEASGHARVYQALGDQHISER